MNEDKYWEEQRITNDPQEMEEYFECDFCGSPIYKNQEYYIFEGDILCEQCFDEVQMTTKRKCQRIAGEDDGD